MKITQRLPSYVSYLSRRGRIESATCTTAGKTEFYRDAVGSVVMTTNYNSPVGKSQRFAAYGKELTPNSYYTNYRMGWVGSMGYRATQLPHAEVYIRARHYSTTNARWTTRDAIWPREPAFGYAKQSPVRFTDYFGHAPSYPTCSNPPSCPTPDFCKDCKDDCETAVNDFEAANLAALAIECGSCGVAGSGAAGIGAGLCGVLCLAILGEIFFDVYKMRNACEASYLSCMHPKPKPIPPIYKPDPCITHCDFFPNNYTECYFDCLQGKWYDYPNPKSPPRWP